MKKIVPIAVAVALVAGGGSFYAGAAYGKSKSAQGFRGGNGALFRNLMSDQRQQAGGQMAARGGVGAGERLGGGFVGGDIISKDDISITVKTREGGTKIVFCSGYTEVGKFVSGSIDDLAVGDTVMVSGKANDDGSVTAQSIQLRPDVQQPTAAH